MDDQNSLHRELKEQEFGSSSLKLLEAGESREEDKGRRRRRGSRGVDTGRVDQLLQFVTAELFFFFGSSCSSSSSRCSWCSWCLVKRWCGSGVGRMRECVKGAGARVRIGCIDGCVALSYIGAAEMAQGRGRWRKWRGGVVGDGSGAGPSLFSFLLPTHMGCLLLYHLYPFPVSSSPS